MSFRPLRATAADFHALVPGRRAFQGLGVAPPAEAPASDGGAREELPAPPMGSMDDEGSVEEAIALAGREEGYEAGYHEGLATARAELERAMGVARELVHQLETTRAQVLSSSRSDVIDFVASCLDWLHVTTVESDRELIVRVVDAALEELQGGDGVTVAIHPDDHEALAAELSLGRKAWATWEVTVRADEQIERGGCVIEAPEGRVEATVTDRLQRLRAELERLRGDGDGAAETLR